VGKSVGTLYFVNTLGSAFASAAAVLFVMKAAGLKGTVQAAAVLNLTVSLLAYVAHRRSQRPAEVAATLAVATAVATAGAPDADDDETSGTEPKPAA
jgi:spermidine synthase